MKSNKRINMLQPIMHILNQKKIILASGSESRRDYIKNSGLTVELCPSLFEENLEPKNFKTFSAFVEETALQKVLEVEGRLIKDGCAPDVIIGGDTMVTLEGKMFGKPTSEEQAFDMLSRLSGKKNTVITGIALKVKDKGIFKFTDSTDVFFGNLTDEQIWGYIKTGEPMRMAGAYAIQGGGSTLVERIDGNYFTVLGMPIYRLCAELMNIFANEERTEVNKKK